jgi:HD-GYP domain-containing protein (c-di-GMP phosphodiesterase class II)
MEEKEHYTICPHCGEKIDTEDGCESCTFFRKSKEMFSTNQILMEEIAELREGAKMSLITQLKFSRQFLDVLMAAIDMKDSYTGKHNELVHLRSVEIGRQLGLGVAELDKLGFSAKVHDIGKFDTPEKLLKKPDKLTDTEYEKVKEHVIKGVALCRKIDYLVPTIPVVLHHHERWDGNGYPDGLNGEHIPLHARIVAISDTVDSLYITRPYRHAWAKGQILKELEDCA